MNVSYVIRKKIKPECHRRGSGTHNNIITICKYTYEYTSFREEGHRAN